MDLDSKTKLAATTTEKGDYSMNLDSQQKWLKISYSYKIFVGEQLWSCGRICRSDVLITLAVWLQ